MKIEVVKNDPKKNSQALKKKIASNCHFFNQIDKISFVRRWERKTAKTALATAPCIHPHTKSHHLEQKIEIQKLLKKIKFLFSQNINFHEIIIAFFNVLNHFLDYFKKLENVAHVGFALPILSDRSRSIIPTSKTIKTNIQNLQTKWGIWNCFEAC